MTRQGRPGAAIAACLALVGLATLAPTRPRFAVSDQGMGPRDVAVIPIESVPAWVSEGVSRTLPDELMDLWLIEILAVLHDPRDVPVDRFLYALTDRGEVMVHPEAEAIRRSLETHGHSAVAVYVRVTARAEICEGCIERDPFFTTSLENIERNPDTYNVPWNAMGVEYEEDGIPTLPCLEPMAIDERARVFTAPDTGATIQPDEYLPPMPHYVVTDNASNPDLLQGEMAAGEVREGWVLCLAPDVPVEDVRIGSSWAPVQEMAIGEWYLLEDRQVLGWNEGPTLRRGEDPIHLDEQVVYEGDVWVSMAQAMRFIYEPYVDRDGNPVEPYEEQIRVQMYFEGMEKFLGIWDQLALRDGLVVTRIEDIYEIRVSSVLREETVDLRARGSSLIVGKHNWSTEGYRLPSERMWIYPGDFLGSLRTGPLKVWRVEFQEIDMRNLTTDAICAIVECLTVEKALFESDKVEVSEPVIPLGTRAMGLTVHSASLVSLPILRAYGLDVYRYEGHYAPEDRNLLVVEVEAADSSVGLSAYNTALGAEDWNFETARRWVSYGSSSGYEVLGGSFWDDTWLSYARRASNRILLVAEVSADWRLEDIVLLGGPVYELQ